MAKKDNRFAALGQKLFRGKTHYLFVLDKSGSMDPIKRQTISGFNETLGDIRAEEPDAPVTVVLFDYHHESLVVARPASEVPELNGDNYQTGGGTALYDAMGGAIQAHEEKVGARDRALVCIVTDGEENSSREFDKQQAMELVNRLERQGNWTFTYLSAAPDAFADAQRFGVTQGNVAAFAPTATGTEGAWNVMRSSRLAYSMSAGGQSASFYSGTTSGTTVPTGTVGDTEETEAGGENG